MFLKEDFPPGIEPRLMFFVEGYGIGIGNVGDVLHEFVYRFQRDHSALADSLAERTK